MPRKVERVYKKRAKKAKGYTASAKIMLSYDYCHFEICLGTDQKLDPKGINEMRKSAQRLADEAVRQYKKAKDMAAKREGVEYEIANLRREAARIESLPENERTPKQQAILKQVADEAWERYHYDYQDDEDVEF